MEFEEPAFYEVMRDLARSGSDKMRRVTAGHAVADARTLVRDREALVMEINRLRTENGRLQSIVRKLT